MVFNYKYLAIILVFLVTFAAIVEYVRVKRLIAISGQLVAASSPYEQQPNNPQARVIFLGDSTGVGTGASDNRLSLAGRIGQKNPSAEVINMSQNGLRTDGLKSVISSMPDGNFDLIVVHIGGNDIIKNKNLDQSAKHIEQAISQLSPKTKTLAFFTTGNLGEAKLFPAVSRPYFGIRAKQLRNKMIGLVKNYPNVKYVDLFNYRASLGEVGGYAADELHLSDKGYELWYEALKATLTGVELKLQF